MTFAALEEVVFRGYLMGVLSRRFTSGRMVNLLQSLLFTSIHIPRLIHEYSNYLTLIGSLIGLFAMGLIFGGLRFRYKNLGAPWLVHAVYNIGLQYGTVITVYDVLNRLR
jgi:membrane protease YdiL (CAAX protease family)